MFDYSKMFDLSGRRALVIGGASGNMLFGAFVDAGADLAHIERQLRTIPVEGWTIETERVEKLGVPALYIDVVVPGEDHHDHHAHAHRHPPGMRRLAEVVELFEKSGLSPRQRERAATIATRLGEAEAEANGQRADEMRFHAIGQIDAVIDIAASVIALDLLDIERLFCSSYPIGRKSSREIALLIGDAPSHAVAIDNWTVTTTAAAVGTPRRRAHRQVAG